MGADAISCDSCRRSGHCHAVGPLYIPTGLHDARPVPCNCGNHNSQKRLCEYPKPSNLIPRMSVMNKSPVKGYLGQCAEQRDRETRHRHAWRRGPNEPDPSIVTLFPRNTKILPRHSEDSTTTAYRFTQKRTATKFMEDFIRLIPFHLRGAQGIVFWRSSVAWQR